MGIAIRKEFTNIGPGHWLACFGPCWKRGRLANVCRYIVWHQFEFETGDDVVMQWREFSQCSAHICPQLEKFQFHLWFTIFTHPSGPYKFSLHIAPCHWKAVYPCMHTHGLVQGKYVDWNELTYVDLQTSCLSHRCTVPHALPKAKIRYIFNPRSALNTFFFMPF